MRVVVDNRRRRVLFMSRCVHIVGVWGIYEDIVLYVYFASCPPVTRYSMGNCGSKYTGTYCRELATESLDADPDIVGPGVCLKTVPIVPQTTALTRRRSSPHSL